MLSHLSMLFLTLLHSPSVMTKTPTKTPAIKPLDAKMSSLFGTGYAANCIDGSTTNYKMCHTGGKESYPWVTLVIPRSFVTKVRITNRKDGYEDRMKNMKIWVGKEFPSTTNVEYTGGALLGTFKGPGTKGQVVEFFSKAKEASTHVVVQMETDYINLLEIEVFGFPDRNTGKLWRSDGRCGKGFHGDMGTPGQCNPEASANQEGPCCSSVNWCGNSDAHCKCVGCVDYSAPCIDTGCKKTGVADDVEAECVYLKNVNWTSISHIYNVSTPWKEGLCKGADSKEDCCKCLPRLPVGCVDVKNACKDAFGGWGVCKNFVKDDMSAIDFEQGSKKGLCNVAEPDCCECFSLKKTKSTKP